MSTPNKMEICLSLIQKCQFERGEVTNKHVEVGSVVAAIDPGQGRGMGGNSRKTTGLFLRAPPCGLEVRIIKTWPKEYLDVLFFR